MFPLIKSSLVKNYDPINPPFSHPNRLDPSEDTQSSFDPVPKTYFPHID